MIIKYVCSNGKEFDLYGENMRATSGNFHTYKWKPISESCTFGEKVSGFGKEACEYALTLTFRGNLAERKKFLNELIDCFDYDTANNNSGRIYFGDYYIDCFVVSAGTAASEIVYWTQCEITLFCPYPFWIKEQKFSFLKQEEDVIESDKETGLAIGVMIPEFMWDFSRYSNAKRFHNSSISASDFVMNIYGYCNNPKIMINNRPYAINAEINIGERIEIDSKERTVYRIGRFGEITNLWNSRDKNYSIFQKIPSGYNTISWTGTYGVDITIFDERSEPRWSL